MKKFVLNYDEKNNDLAVSIAEKIVDCLNDGEYCDLETAICYELDIALMYYEDQWELLKTYQKPYNANYNVAFEMLIDEIHSVIEESEESEIE